MLCAACLCQVTHNGLCHTDLHMKVRGGGLAGLLLGGCGGAGARGRLMLVVVVIPVCVEYSRGSSRDKGWGQGLYFRVCPPGFLPPRLETPGS